MIATSLIGPFLRVPLFEGLTPLQLTEIAHNAERMIFRDGETITRAGDKGYCAYLIVRGKLLCRLGGETGDTTSARGPLAAGQGTLISEMAMLIDGHCCPATITADGQVRAYRLSRAALQAQMQDDRDLAEHFVGKITERLLAMADELRKINGTLAPDETPIQADRAIA